MRVLRRAMRLDDRGLLLALEGLVILIEFPPERCPLEPRENLLDV
jgi:hypothetical protein